MTTQHVRTFLHVAPRLPATTSILLRGNHGIGKSQVVRQAAKLIAEAEGINDYEIIDRRLSQMSEGDMIGLPSTDGEVTRFNPPDWYRRACQKPCCLFLDELNRATHEVMQAAFQIVLDRELNGWKLHPQTRVFSAVNSSAAYTVNEIDPALLDRFWCVDLNPDTEDWLTWAKGEGNISPVIMDFIASQDKWLDPPKQFDPGTVSPSRRSWERLSQALVSADIADNPASDLFYSMSLGFIGTEASIAFLDFAKTIDNQVSGEEILNTYEFADVMNKKTKKLEIVPSDGKTKKKIERHGVERLNVAIDKVTDHTVKEYGAKGLSECQGKNLDAFMQNLPPEQRVSCWMKLTQSGMDTLPLAKSIHKFCVKGILDIFGVPPGAAGVGVVPNIPGAFAGTSEKK